MSGSDHHLNNQAEEPARRSSGAGSDQHLYNQAERLEAARAPRASDQHLGSRTRSASVPFSRPEDLAMRAILAAEAERYVDQQQDRGESNSTGDESSAEFVPGSRHMPAR